MKSNIRYLAGSLMLGSVLIGGFYAMNNTVRADIFERGEHDEEREHQAYRLDQQQDPKMAALYKVECGSCHMAYPPAFLPATSWQKLLNGLSDHFGENAELDKVTLTQLKNFLEKESQNGSRKMQRNIGDESPIRITQLPYFKAKHHELPANVLKLSPKLTSMSQCNVCHSGAERGDFNEDNVSIPGLGTWD